ncbi:hypothetical protein [Paramuribaculum intestinale]|uniref:hypothetical protein n=1 Tax=Paramuribaculum intestinale TaxID=2094151 RepID=UPI003F68D628
MNHLHFISAAVAVMTAMATAAAQDKNDFNPVQTGVNSLAIARMRVEPRWATSARRQSRRQLAVLESVEICVCL